MKFKKYFKRITFIFKFKRFIPFLKDFFLSKEVTLQKKAFSVLMILAYAFFPFDIIPDFLTFFGIVDDLIVVTFILERMIKMAPHSLKVKHQLFD
jgi:uncharacterized membrane protein YkvA (DUF1232 family)